MDQCGGPCGSLGSEADRLRACSAQTLIGTAVQPHLAPDQGRTTAAATPELAICKVQFRAEFFIVVAQQTNKQYATRRPSRVRPPASTSARSSTAPPPRPSSSRCPSAADCPSRPSSSRRPTTDAKWKTNTHTPFSPIQSAPSPPWHSRVKADWRCMVQS